MKFTAPRAGLVSALAAAARLAPVRAANPVYSGAHLHVTTDGDTPMLVVTAGDGENWLRTRIAVTADTSGEVVVPAHLAADLLKDLPGDTLECELTEEHLSISLERGKYTLPRLGSLGSSAPALGDHVATIEGGVLAAVLTTVGTAASRDSATPVLTGVRLELADNQLTVAATDRYRLATKTVTVAETGEKATAFTIAAKQAADIVKLLGKSSEVRIYTSGTTAAFADEQTVVHTRLLAGDYPAWRTLLASTPTTWVSVETEALAGVLKRISRLGGDIVDLQFEGETITLSGHGTGSGSESIALARTETNDDTDEAITIRFNPTYLVDGLLSFPETVQIGYTSPNKAVQLTDGNGHTYLAMPRR